MTFNKSVQARWNKIIWSSVEPCYALYDVFAIFVLLNKCKHVPLGIVHRTDMNFAVITKMDSMNLNSEFFVSFSKSFGLYKSYSRSLYFYVEGVYGETISLYLCIMLFKGQLQSALWFPRQTLKTHGWPIAWNCCLFD